MTETILLGRATGLAVAAGLTALLCLLTNLPMKNPSRSAGATRTGSLLKPGRWPSAERSKPGIL